MRGLLALSRLIDGLNVTVGRLVSWVILMVVIVSATNAVFRKAFDMSSNAWLELQWYMFGAIFLLSAGYTLLRNGHVRVDILNNKLSERKQVGIDIFGILILFLPVCVYILYLSIPQAIESYVLHETSSNAGGLIRWPVKALIPLGFFLLSLAGVSHLIKCIGFLRGQCANPLRLDAKSQEEALADEIASNATDNTKQQAEGR
ncbi:MAG TPA: C4-dicarboxylate ABC transporter substrate-binding protein [Pusillimonas sp.]|jgi:TRAP-type mannitol/chloroaromatic compound transport system permease small subunit|nr:C4-dicarboxylate ABC transporter substrate-binding protein [Pusillimonas sp.]MBC42111.1 C4-dicarboxylate ABC transporter substrate-binding protein [Pusillimonas sp.]HBT34411.1 C4-dicarboxylate ABC transporter substrate-binding protein [Pusillimonas sp.]HCN73660.1 C4-dicarboxylate ABC transporter substrate-binding protein [Pusillimonas sp.]HCP76437.1 C4-dicarboxylate ABC transporter substrate-binding protein [Pusillimonas sp.]|tara:strand:+ start:103356 stop:103964 length:609 start_codon:yes stop_codon:yes gene_type:complete